MRARISDNPLICAPTDALYAPLPFLIASTSQKLVNKYPLIFELGKAEYNYGIDLGKERTLQLDWIENGYYHFRPALAQPFIKTNTTLRVDIDRGQVTLLFSGALLC